MKKNTNKKIIIIGIVVSIIVIVIVVILLVLASSQKNNKGKINNEDNEYLTDADKGNEQYQLEYVRDLTDFYSVEDVLKKHKGETFEAEDMKFLQGNRILTYVVLGNDKNCYIVRVDVYNLTYEAKQITEGNFEEITVSNEENEIVNNGNNNFEYKQISNEDSARMYYKEINNLEINENKKLYDKLDKDYREKRFSTYQEYQTYTTEMKDLLQNAVISKYLINEKDEYREYTLVDNFNNTYTVRAKSVKNYEVLLDNYTIKVDDYVENYKKLSDEDKVQANLYIFIQMINTKDYKNAYNLLADSFKNNYFKDEVSFEKYMKENWFLYNLQTDIDIKNEGNNYICNLTLRSGAGSAAEQVNKTIIMRLKENTDFVMSFTV